jgi:trans-2,3-dihydro-3-hydroxyanthranilate isomerase
MRYRFATTDVFTDRRFGGNPLAVLLDARGLDSAQMLQVAREFNLSETVFVLPPEDPRHTRKLRIFTPHRELPFAGHPTVGTAYLLGALGEVPLTGDETAITFEEGVGPVAVRLVARNGTPTFAELTAARPPEFSPAPAAPAALAEVCSLTAEDLARWAEPQIVSCGVPFLFIPFRDRQVLARARGRLDRWEAIMPGVSEVYLVTRDPELPGSDLRARMFALGLGIAEDPATGAAVTALGGFLGVRESAAEGSFRWVVEQGFEMGRPSLLHLTVEKRGGEIAAIRVGGGAVLVSEGTIEVP